MFRSRLAALISLLHHREYKGGVAGGAQTTLSSKGVLPGNSIARWTLLRLGLLLLLLGAGFYAVSAYLLERQFDAFEAEQYRQDVARVAAVIEQDRAGLASYAKDYAEWDDTYQFIQDRNTTYIESNYTADSVANLRADAVVLFTLNHEVALSLALKDASLQPMPPAEINQLKTIISQPDLSDLLAGKTLITRINDEPVLIAITDIVNSDLDLPANGQLVLVRKLNDSYLESIRHLTGVTFNLVPATPGTDTIVINHSNNHWQVTKALGNQAVAIVIDGPGRLGKERLITNAILAGNALLLVVLSLFGIRAILNRRVLNRLTLFSALADRHRDKADDAVRWPVEGRDELDNLASSLNELMDEVSRHHGNLSYLAEHDSLTDLGNRRQLMARLKSTLNMCQRQPEFQCSFLLVDLDSFKLINDELGHAAGDWVLQEVAKRIRTLIRNSDTLVRLGGDEFALLLNQISPEYALQFAERMLHALSAPASFQGNHLTIGASIGIAQLLPELEADDVLRNADLAMYEAKRLGKKRAVVFDESLLAAATR